MFTIITALEAEHAALRALFDRIERALPGLEQAAAVQQCARQVESLLCRHAAMEDDLMLLVWEAQPERWRAGHRFQREHREIDARLVEAQQTNRVAAARRLLREALAASRRHFEREERLLFPQVAQVVASSTLERLGAIWSLHVPAWMGEAGAERLPRPAAVAMP